MLLKIFKKLKNRFLNSNYIKAVLYSFKKLVFNKNENIDKYIFKRTITKFFFGRLGENKYNIKIYVELENKFTEGNYFNFNGIKHPKIEEKHIKGFVYDFLDIYYLPFFHPKCVIDEGPYFFQKAIINKGDIVIDAGASTGIFSALASNLGAKVFSFEPVQDVLHHLKITANLNSDINVVPLALHNFKGEIEIQKDKEDLRASSLIISRKDCSTEIINTITLDEWVKENKLTKIDFIKADIEGAERYMLQGSKWVLKHFAPKLAISAYHLEDDIEVLSQLIIEANPKYRIVNKWQKIYAWVEN